MGKISPIACVRSITVEPLLFLYMTTFTMGAPVLQNIGYIKLCMLKYDAMEMCLDLTKPEYHDQHKYVQEEAAVWNGYTLAGATVPSFFIAFVIGPWGDRFGRKLPMIVPCVGSLFATLLSILNTVYLVELPMWFSLVPAVVGGSTGGMTVVLMATISFLSEVTSETDRTTRISLAEASFLLGGLVGGLLAGVTIGGRHLWLPLLVVEGIQLVLVVYIVVVIREAGGRKVEGEAGDVREVGADGVGRCGKCVVLSYMMDTVRTTFFKDRHKHGRLHISLIMIIVFLSVIPFMGNMEVMMLFTRDAPLSWSPTFYSYFITYSTLVGSFGLAVLLPILKRFARCHDITLVILGLLSTAGGNVLLSFATTTWLVFLAILLRSSCGSFLLIGCRGHLSKIVGMSEQGKLFAVLSSIENLAAMVGTFLYTNIFKLLEASDIKSGYIFLIGPPLILVALLMAAFVKRDITQQDTAGEMGHTTLLVENTVSSREDP